MDWQGDPFFDTEGPLSQATPPSKPFATLKDTDNDPKKGIDIQPPSLLMKVGPYVAVGVLVLYLMY